MALINVFGVPVTDETVRLVKPDLNRPITARDRAEVALDKPGEDNSHVDALTFLVKIMGDYGNGTTTPSMIYNATGDDLTLVLNHTWEGHIWRHPLPRLIKNGQWAVFLHVTDRLTAHSKEAVVYRGTNDDGLSCDWMLAWNTLPIPITINNQHRAYTEIRESNGGFDWANWYAIDAAMEKQSGTDNHTSTLLGCVAQLVHGHVSIYSVLMGLMTLDGVGANFKVISQSLFSKYDVTSALAE